VISAAASSDGTESIDIHRRDGKHMYVTGAMWQEGMKKEETEKRRDESSRSERGKKESNEKMVKDDV